jgi:threonyl-tRNA synthetase
MKKLGLVDYEPASDIGHFRFYPKGTIVKRLLEEFATNLAIEEIGCVQIETPSLYRVDFPDIAGQIARFVEKDYRFEVDERKLTLRFAGDFGLFRMLKDVIVSYRQLPIRIYELSPSYRLEKRGECVGLKRLRGFTMPDVHCFCKDIEQGMREFKMLLKFYTKLIESMEVDYVLAFRAVKDFYENSRSWFIDLVKIAGKPALIELLPERKHYWIVKQEHQTIDYAGGNAQLCTIQLDIEDAERYGLYYIDADGERRPYTIIHSSMGSIERWIYAILEQAAKMQREGKAPMLPIWLSPIQVRVLPISKGQLEYAKVIANELKEAGIRVDIDDRDITLAKKVRDAETEWIPYIVTVGRREEERESITVRIRGAGIEEWKVSQLIERILKETKGKPRVPLSLQLFLSNRPKFS